MKKTKLINSELSFVISTMGHGDKLVVCDAGLPINDSSPRIDLALRKGLPSFIETLEVVLEELEVEKIIIALEIKNQNPSVHSKIIEISKEKRIPVEYISHSDFKKSTHDAKAVVRTGEYSPYANIILVSGVVF